MTIPGHKAEHPHPISGQVRCESFNVAGNFAVHGATAPHPPHGAFAPVGPRYRCGGLEAQIGPGVAFGIHVRVVAYFCEDEAIHQVELEHVGSLRDLWGGETRIFGPLDVSELTEVSEPDAATHEEDGIPRLGPR